MRLSFALTLLALSTVSGFAPVSKNWVYKNAVLQSTVEAETSVEEAVDAPPSPSVEPVSPDEYKSRLEAQLEKMKAKDQSSKALSKDDISVVFEDDHIVVVNKPSGVLTVSGEEGIASLGQAVFDAIGCQMGRADKMVVHRLGMDTSGLIVFAKTMDALRGMNTLFRTRKVTRQYEALVCGHVENDKGLIDLPLMRDYEFPPYMRVSTDDHQSALINLSAADVGKKVLEQPKNSLTKYEVIAREEMDGHPVTRIALTSISGRTHQLNVHCAAFGHPIVGDVTYGIDGEAAPNGGLSAAEQEELVPNPSRASEELQKQIGSAASGKGMCVHAKSISFRHPCIKREVVSLSVDSPF